ELSVRRCLTYAAWSHGIKPDAAAAAVETAARRVGLSDRLEARASELSRGLRQRLAIGQSIVHSPKVLLLDEPAAGLDPQARKELSTLLLALKGEGMTIVVSSHILAELEDYCSEMIILERGRVVGGKPIVVRKDDRPRYLIELATPRADLGEFLRSNGATDVIEVSDMRALIAFTHNLGARAKLVRDLVTAGFDVARFGESTRALEDAYFAQVAHEAAQ
ncbi:MAG TPA: ABC transporter ATP-binding protein, partial [Rhizomicrobium sp.]|nr:ABC transporter ATP-binding protein [Rhizomicrobium sp.]